MADDPVLVEVRGAICRLVLNRPDRRNALDHRTIEALLDALDAAERDEANRVIVLAGAGPGFCAGADLKEAKGLVDPEAIARHARLMARLLLAPWRCAKPVVAEVHGFALGAGLGLALACDAIVCTGDARLAFPETRHGMVPALVAPTFLRKVGHAVAFEFLAGGQDIPVARAASLGLLRSVPRETLATETAQVAAGLAALPGDIVLDLKKLLREAAGVDLPAAMEIAEGVNVAGKVRRLGTGA